MHEALTSLLEAHVRHELALFEGDRLTRMLAEQVSALFRWFADVTLDDVMTRAQIIGVIERYAIGLRVSGGITELSGEMSQVVFKSRATASTRLDQILTPAMYEEFADKVLALEGVRRELIALIAQSATVHATSARLFARGLVDLLALVVPVSSQLSPPALTAFVTKLGAGILPGLERLASDAFARHRDRFAREREQVLLELLDVDRLRSLADELWDRLSPLPLSEVFALIGEQDVEDFVVLIYEFWVRYRETPFFHRIATELVDHFFHKYGQATLLALVDDMGVNESMVTEEVVALLQPIVEHAVRSGALERGIYERLEAFYRSPAAAAALGE